MPLVTTTRINPDGTQGATHKWLCTSPIHYRNILINELMSSLAGVRFLNDRHYHVPLHQVGKVLATHQQVHAGQ